MLTASTTNLLKLQNEKCQQLDVANYSVPLDPSSLISPRFNFLPYLTFMFGADSWAAQC